MRERVAKGAPRRRPAPERRDAGTVAAPPVSGRLEWRFDAIAVHPPTVADAVATGLSAPATRLPPAVRRPMERRLGARLGEVGVHTGPAARRSAAALDARAYAAGQHVVLARDADLTDPGTGVLAHELAHVAQNRRAVGSPPANRLARHDGGAEREAARAAAFAVAGLPAPPIRAAGQGVARTRTSDTVRSLISYGLTDWAVTAAEEADVLAELTADSDLSRTVTDLASAGALRDLFDRIVEPANQRDLLRLFGGRLDASARALVEPHVRRLGPGAELQYNLARHGVAAGAPAFDPAPLEAALVATARTGRSGTSGGHLTEPFTGVGATGVIPTTRYAGTFLTTPGVAQIPIEDQALLAVEHGATETTYRNPVSGRAPSLASYLATLSTSQREQQAELLLRRPIASVEARSYAGSLPSRAQVIEAAARAHNLHAPLVAAFILAEQRDQSQAEDAADYQAATSVLQSDTSIGLGQVVVATARRRDLFADLLSAETRSARRVDTPRQGGHNAAARLLASDELNIFAVARYIRWVADQGAPIPIASLPQTASFFPGLDMAAYARNSATWPDDNIRALASEYTSRPWDEANPRPGETEFVVPDWGDWVFEAYRDVLASGVFGP
jgi:hypothetical protein